MKYIDPIMCYAFVLSLFIVSLQIIAVTSICIYIYIKNRPVKIKPFKVDYQITSGGYLARTLFNGKRNS